MDALGHAAMLAFRLPEVHPSDSDEFRHHLHALQNILLARPATEAAQHRRLDEILTRNTKLRNDTKEST